MTANHSKLDEMRAYVATRREDTGTSLSTASELETLALAAIDEARAEERARCVGALRERRGDFETLRDGEASGLDLAIETLEALK